MKISAVKVKISAVKMPKNGENKCGKGENKCGSFFRMFRLVFQCLNGLFWLFFLSFRKILIYNGESKCGNGENKCGSFYRLYTLIYKALRLFLNRFLFSLYIYVCCLSKNSNNSLFFNGFQICNCWKFDNFPGRSSGFFFIFSCFSF